MSGILDAFRKLKYPEPPQIVDDDIEANEDAELERPCGHVFEGKCQLNGIVPANPTLCNCSQRS